MNNIEAHHLESNIDAEKNRQIFLDKVFELDQSDQTRANAERCLTLLRNKEGDFVGTSLEKEYWDAVSFELFHLAQNSALSGDLEQVKKQLVESLSAAQSGFNDAWRAYVQGTLYYFQKDIAGLKSIIPLAEENSNVLSSLLKGLEERGWPDYRKDY